MTPYFEYLILARRWDKAVDFGSPRSAWTDEMLAEKLNSRQEDVSAAALNQMLTELKTKP